MLRKSLFLFVVLIMLSGIAFCQKKVKKNPWYAPKEDLMRPKFFYELFGGLNYPVINYSTDIYDGNKRTLAVFPDFGLAGRIQLKKWFSINPRISYLSHSISFSGDDGYTMKSNNINLTLPVDFQFQLGKRNHIASNRFFVYAGPYIGIPVSGLISVDDFSSKLKMNDMAKPDYGIEAGLGFRIPTFSLESTSNITFRLSYLHGLADTYSVAESTIKPEYNSKLFLDGGKRFNSGVLLVVGIEIPKSNKKMITFTAGGDGKKNYKKIVIIDEK